MNILNHVKTTRFEKDQDGDAIAARNTDANWLRLVALAGEPMEAPKEWGNGTGYMDGYEPIRDAKLHAWKDSHGRTWLTFDDIIVGERYTPDGSSVILLGHVMDYNKGGHVSYSGVCIGEIMDRMGL